MDIKVDFDLEDAAEASVRLSRQLRDLYRSARTIQHHAPYAAARLARIADQAEYFVQQWPASHWPYATSTNSPIPAREVLLRWLATAKAQATEAAQLPQPCSYTSWHQATSMLLAALVAFA